ncbi:UNVERIFIED_CONTAM: protein SLOW WALKER 1 [Sesamum radiatum]|uniref:Protein SLOW WALKER 1 n=1 Tax=Sesamum radiatum TaxID=300843 RepID=A0AAW2W1I6_SESRA
MESHNKTVTALCMGKVGRVSGDEAEQNRILSVSLDGYMKVFDYANFKITYSMRFPHPLLSVGFSPDSLTRVIGTSKGILYIGRRKGKVESADLGDSVGLGAVEDEPQRRVLRPSYFRHKEALAAVLSGKNPENVVAVMEELILRKKLLKCVSNLDTEELGLLLGFLQKYSTMPRYAGLLTRLVNKVVELRAEDIRSSDQLRGHIRNLKRDVEEEIRIQQSLLEIQGIISPMLRIAARR